MDRSRVSLLLSGFVAGAFVAGPLLHFWAQLPDPVATHWTLQGQPNGASSKQLLLWLGLGLALFPLPCAWLASGARRAWVRRVSVTAFVCLTLFSGLLNLEVVRTNWGNSNWHQAKAVSAIAVALLVIAPLVCGVFTLFVSQRFWPSVLAPLPPPHAWTSTTPAHANSDTTLRDWHGSASNTGLLALAPVLVLSALVFGFAVPAGWSRAVFFGAHGLALLAIEELWRIRVDIDRDGVHIRYGSFGWLRQRFALDRITAAAFVDVNPWAWGGWGYRGSLSLLRRAAVVVRSGDALCLQLDGAKQLTVTVDDAQTGIALLQRFHKRSESSVQDSSAARS